MPLFYWIMVYGWPPKMKDRKALQIKEDGIGRWVRAATADLKSPKSCAAAVIFLFILDLEKHMIYMTLSIELYDHKHGII